jgi:hypothetical protein
LLPAGGIYPITTTEAGTVNVHFHAQNVTSKDFPAIVAKVRADIVS